MKSLPNYKDLGTTSTRRIKNRNTGPLFTFPKMEWAIGISEISLNLISKRLQLLRACTAVEDMVVNVLHAKTQASKDARPIRRKLFIF